MRIHAVSDVHVDYDINAQWVTQLSTREFQDDVLILAGDLSDSLSKLERALEGFARRFKQVLFLPGNHDLWVHRDTAPIDSFQKLEAIREVAARCGVSMSAYHHGTLSIVPLWSWYDDSFGAADESLRQVWMDFRACRWPEGWTLQDVAAAFFAMNREVRRPETRTLISFSHFLPRLDVMPAGAPLQVQQLYPVFGSTRLEAAVRALEADIHVYGHSHLNRQVSLSGTLYINNAFGYPRETRIAAKALTCIHESA